MNEKTKESKFLEAINRYAEKQKAFISDEVEEYKKQKIEQATEAGLKDAYELIQSEVEHRKAAIISDYSLKEAQLRSGLYRERTRISDEVFSKAKDKLCEYTLTDAYRERLLRSAADISGHIGDKACVLYIRQADMRFSDELLKVLPAAEINPDDSIIIGGLKAYCPDESILLDDTLDSRLEAQRGYFAEHSGLKVVEG